MWVLQLVKKRVWWYKACFRLAARPKEKQDGLRYR